MLFAALRQPVAGAFARCGSGFEIVGFAGISWTRKSIVPEVIRRSCV
jgi:hypothetical protein